MKDTISRDKQKLTYKTIGNIRRTPVVLIPGFAVDHTLWGDFLDLLAAHYYVILIDHRGTGLNIKHPFPTDMTTLTQDIAAVLKAENFESAHIIGHSMGGYIAQYFAHYYPALVSSLILISTYNQKLSNQTWNYNSLMALINLGVDRETLIINSMPWLYGAEYMENERHCLDHIKRMNEREFPTPLDTILAQIKLINNFDAADFSRDLTVKTLLIGGDEDRIIPEVYFKRFSQVLPHAELVIVKEAGHIIHIEKPKEIARLITSFIG